MLLASRSHRGRWVLFLCLAATITFSAVARAEEVGGSIVPPQAELPQQLNLEDALRLFRAHGFDVLIAEAAVMTAEGDKLAAGASPNPAVNLSVGRSFNYDPAVTGCVGCSSTALGAGISDQASIMDALSGKKRLRVKVADAALAAAKLSRVDALRTLEYQVKEQYFQVVFARAALDFAKEVRISSEQTLELNKKRYALGAIDEGVLARVETSKLEADQATDRAAQALRQTQVAMAFLLGFRGRVPDFDVDRAQLNFAIPAQLQAPSSSTLLRQAFDHRPDLKSLGYQRSRAESSIELEKRKRFPDVALFAQYNQTGSGQNAIQPPTLTFGITAPLPLLYQQQGEIQRAEADYRTQSLLQGKLYAQVAADVESALSSFTVSRQLVERMETALLARARTARDIVKRQFEGGTASLIDFLDAQRTFTATSLEYLQDLTNYWTAVAQLEQAVGMELRKQ